MNYCLTQLKNICTYALFFGVGVVLWPQGVGAFFSNLETASAQQFQASSLALEPISVPDSVTLINDQEPVVFPVNIETKDGSVEALYDLEFSAAGPSADWCNSLFINATSTENNLYNSVADGFLSNSEASFGLWQIGVYTDDIASAPVGTACTLSVTVSAWQENLSKGVGYQDTKTLEFEVIVGDEIATFETFSFATEESVEPKSVPEGEVKREADETNQGDTKETESIEPQTEESNEVENEEASATDQTLNEPSEATEEIIDTSNENKDKPSTEQDNITKPEENELAHEQTHELTHEQDSQFETETEDESEAVEVVDDQTSTEETKEPEPESPLSDDKKVESSTDSEKSAVDESEDKSENNPPQQDNQGDGESEKGVREEESNSTETEDESKSDDV
jgi:hypothetical protein